MIDQTSTEREILEIPCVARVGTFDELNEAGYLAANADIRLSGWSPAEHFRKFGHAEGRLQAVNQEQIAAMREEKLRKLRFRREPVTPRTYGQPANFVSYETTAEFGIPEIPYVSSLVYGGPFVAEVRSNPDKLCLDVGAGLRFSCFQNVINVDIYPSLSTDVMSVGEDLPFEDEQFDYVMCIAVLEHTRRPWQVARELCRVLKRGGKFLVDYPFLQQFHACPNHYFNATPSGAISLFEPYCDIESSTVHSNQHPIYAITGILEQWRDGLRGDARSEFERLTVEAILGRPPEGHLAADYCTELTQETQRVVAAGSTVTGTKRRAVEPATSHDPPYSMLMRLRSRETELKKASARIEHLENELGGCEQRLQSNLQTVNDVFHSRSWRLTAPFRAAAHMLRHMKSSG